jgi:hypothetical protein
MISASIVSLCRPGWAAASENPPTTGLMYGLGCQRAVPSWAMMTMMVVLVVVMMIVIIIIMLTTILMTKSRSASVGVGSAQ